MAEFCEKCGANLDLVGRSHNCRPSLEALEREIANMAGESVANPRQVANEVAKKMSDDPTYGRYADKEKRKEYMRQYMAKRRRRGK